ncbi:hypothetical protein KDL01_02310 [Actinospica durhamensis]|uniref:Uncharacterized protein n=1 Tax=Actinospica durhamensis TaxID=1508375 RepID=A0A941EK99_9ACTN|nr:hypothetical protein [Actinospica durhamensis]MBR7832072.1 hypothetical protein [Actinospica durhamensis]
MKKKPPLPSGTTTRRTLSVFAGFLLALTTTAGTISSASAATAPAHTQATSSSSTTPTEHKAAAAATATATGKQAFKPVQPAKAARPGPLTAAQDAARAAAARSVIAHSTVPDTCSGAIAADTVYPCTTPSATGTDTFTVTLTSSHDLLVFDVLNTSSPGGGLLPVSITPPGGTATTCTAATYARLPGCATNAAGTYTIQVTNYGVDYTIDYLPLLSDSSCTAADPTFATWTPLTGTIAAGQAGACFSLDALSGDVLSDDALYGNELTVYDSTGTAICDDDQGVCTLSGVAPYRLLDTYTSGGSYSYGMYLKDITDPTGCVATAQAVYGTAPDVSSPVLCRTLTVTQAGSYQVAAVAPVGYSGITGSLFTPAGVPACTNGGPLCQLAAGTYDYVFNEWPGATGDDFGVEFTAATESRGCTAAGDSDFQSGDATGTFAGNGAEACLNLPTASGKTDYFNDQSNTDGTIAQVLFIVDATGAQQCTNANFSSLVTCTLTGTAPFRAVLASGGVSSANISDTVYRLLVQRTDSTAGCADWPQSGYGGTPGVSVSLTLANDFGCVSIPAAQHSTGEMVDYSNNSNVSDTGINIYDTAGNQVCFTNGTAVCSYKAGQSYLALIYFVGNSTLQSDTIHLVRRDTSQTASCSAPVSTTVGAASTPINLTSDLDAACYRVTAASTDRLYFNIRTQSPAQTGAVLEVANAAGTIVCRQWGSIGCAVTGSTVYQAIVIASGYNGVTIAAHLDALRVGTSSGWASQCTAHSVSANGWLTPLSGTLSESASSYCAVVAIQPSQWWNLYGADTATADESPVVRMFSTSDWTSGNILCSGGVSVGCQASSNDSGQAVMIVTLGSVQGNTGFSIQGVCNVDCPSHTAFPTMTSVSASSQPQGAADALVVHGTNLNLGTELELMSNDTAPAGYTIATPRSVSTDGTSATYSLDTLNVAPGKYDLGLGVMYGSAPFCSNGQASAQCLYGAYTVTAGRGAASTFVALPTKRIMDTRSGLGVRKGTVAGNGTVSLTVVGVGGVPSTGVTAVELDLTALDQTLGGYVTAYPYGAARPNASDMNFGADQVLTNLVSVPVAQGKIQLYNGAAGTIDLIVDVVGYFSTNTSGSLYTAVTPSRIVNTAAGLGAAKAKVAAHGSLTVTVAGVGGVPSTGVTAVALDVTASGSAGNGFLVSYAPGGTVPAGTDVTYRTGQAHTGLIVVPLVQGKFVIDNGGPQSVDLAMDVEGYYEPGTGSGFQPVGPVRVLDDRSGLGGAGATPVPAGGVAMLPYSSLTGVPGTATAVVLDVVIVAPQTTGTLTVTVDGQPLPGLPNLSYPVSKLTADQIVVPVGSELDFYNNSGGTVQVVADLQGYYTS